MKTAAATVDQRPLPRTMIRSPSIVKSCAVPSSFAHVQANDPTMTVIDLVSVLDTIHSYGYNLGCALLHNTHVQSIENLVINSFLLYDTDNNTKEGDEKKRKRKTVDNDDGGTTTPTRPQGIESAAPFMKFLLETKSLRRLHLTETREKNYGYSDDDIKELLHQIVQAVTHNNELIDEIDLDFYAWREIIAGFFASSIKTFTARILDFDDDDDDDDGANGGSLDLVVQACRHNQTLETLTLKYYVESDFLYEDGTEREDDNNASSDAVAAIVSALVGHTSIHFLTIVNLDWGLEEHAPLMNAIASFVGATTSLKHLKLDNFFFDDDQMQLLLDHLTVHRLSLLGCEIRGESFQLLTSYVRTSTTLKELAISQNLGRGWPRPMYHEMLIDSSLQVLDLSHTADVNVAELLDSEIRLQCLHLGAISQTGWRGLSYGDPHQIYLRELPVDSIPLPNEFTEKIFMDSIEENGSVQSVYIVSKDDGGTTYENQLLESVCKRNQMLGVGGLFQQQQYDTLNHNDDNDGDNGDADDDQGGNNMTIHLSIFPLLLRAASQSQRMGPNFILTGLLSIKDGVCVRN